METAVTKQHVHGTFFVFTEQVGKGRDGAWEEIRNTPGPTATTALTTRTDRLRSSRQDLHRGHGQPASSSVVHPVDAQTRLPWTNSGQYSSICAAAAIPGASSLIFKFSLALTAVVALACIVDDGGIGIAGMAIAFITSIANSISSQSH